MHATMQAGDLTGWYGKLPSLGDFASRRLAPGFVEVWDDWLAAGMADWRGREPASWLDRYLAGPSWRFVLMPGVLPADLGAWAGVLMPSVDKVGRYFPLTLAQPLPCPAMPKQQADALLGWLQQLDDLAVDALHDDWSVDQLEAALQTLGPWRQDPPPSRPPVGNPALAPLTQATLELPPNASVSAMLAEFARDQLVRSLQGRALWLRSDSQGRPALRITAGLPRAADFSALLGFAEAASHYAPTANSRSPS